MVSSINWDDLFLYDESSPTCLRWRVEVLSGRDGNQINVSPGDIAGSLPSSARYHSTVAVGYQYFLAHRIIWEMFNGPLAEGQKIDHEDGDGTNNRISNLRVVTHTVNMRNCKMRVDNKSGVVGVCRFVNRHGTESITASWKMLDGKQKSKTFSISRYGDAEAFRLACEYRANAIDQLNAAGAGYTERHGRNK